MADSIADRPDDDEPPEIVGEPFAILPERVLYADISAHAVRIYAVLQRYVNLPRGAIPSRQTLADSIHISRATANRALRELTDAGLVTVEPRYREGTNERTSSRFILHGAGVVDKSEVGSQVTQRRLTGDTTGRLTGEPVKRVSSKESDRHNPVAARDRLMAANSRRRQGLPPICEKCEDVGVWTDDDGAHHCDCTL